MSKSTNTDNINTNVNQDVTINQNNPKMITTSSKGVLTALLAFLIWGAFPLYFKELSAYDPVEVIVHRVIWTFIFLLFFILVTKSFSWVKLFRDEPNLLVMTFFSGSIVTSNWLTYVWAVNNDHILDASLGYFMSPLIGVALSLIILKEKLRKLQWIAVFIATLAVLIQLIMLGKLPWVSLILALSFGSYGILQRKTPLKTVDALFVETVLVLPFALIWLHYNEVTSSDLKFWFSSEVLLLVLAGPITLVPLLLFNKSTKMVAYSILSFMNYLTPSFLFLLAVFYYHEPFDSNKVIVFFLIWIGLLLFSIDLWQNRPNKSVNKALNTKNSSK